MALFCGFLLLMIFLFINLKSCLDAEHILPSLNIFDVQFLHICCQLSINVVKG